MAAAWVAIGVSAVIGAVSIALQLLVLRRQGAAERRAAVRWTVTRADQPGWPGPATAVKLQNIGDRPAVNVNVDFGEYSGELIIGRTSWESIGPSASVLMELIRVEETELPRINVSWTSAATGNKLQTWSSELPPL